MDTVLRALAPSLWAFIFESGRFTNCAGCPYAIKRESQHSDPSEAEEGWFDCELLTVQKVWGETPLCTEKHWKDAAQTDLWSVLDADIQERCQVHETEEAQQLFGKFWNAVWDDDNATKTGQQIREELMAGVSPRVEAEFKRLLTGAKQAEQVAE